MLLVKTRSVPLSKEKPKRNPNKAYYVPSNYSRIKKTDRNISSYVKNEDLV